MAIIIGVVSQKGGVGKSTLSRLIAREFANNDWDVKIADLDVQQASSYHWFRRRTANDVRPPIRAEAFSSVRQAMKDADNFDLFILDGAPHATTATADIARAADMVLLPSGLSVDDLEPQVILAHDFVREGIPADKIRFVLCRVGDSATEIDEAREYIRKAGYHTLEGELPERSGYRRASDHGLALTETRYVSLNERADLVAQKIIDAISKLSKKKRSAA